MLLMSVQRVEVEEGELEPEWDRSEDYQKGYKAGWMQGARRALKKAGVPNPEFEIKEGAPKPVEPVKRSSAAEKSNDIPVMTAIIIGLVLGGIVLFVVLNNHNKQPNQ